MSEQNDTRKHFLQNGIQPNASKIQKEIFDMIKREVYNYVTRESHDYIPEPGEFRVSSIGYCGRKILLAKNLSTYIPEDRLTILPKWYLDELQGDPSKIQFGAHISGQVVHEMIQTAIKDKIHSMEEEITFHGKNFSLKGHYDLLIEDENSIKIVIDIKSTSSPRNYLPNPKHMKQLMAYQGILGGIEGAILYVHRNDWTMSYIPQAFDKSKFSQLIVKTSNLAINEKNSTLPNIDVSIYESECANEFFRCQFYNYCFSSGENEVKSFSVE